MVPSKLFPSDTRRKQSSKPKENLWVLIVEMALNATASSYVLCFLSDVTAFTVGLEEQIAYPYFG